MVGEDVFRGWVQGWLCWCKIVRGVVADDAGGAYLYGGAFEVSRQGGAGLRRYGNHHLCVATSLQLGHQLTRALLLQQDRLCGRHTSAAARTKPSVDRNRTIG
eukprot:446943-Prorocentrum_minimum.AAC.2